MTPENIKTKVLKEIKELKEKIKIEEKRDIYSGELVRMYSRLKIFETKLEAYEEVLAEVSKCSVCKKKNPIELMSIECPKCYTKGMEKEGFISKEKVGKVIDDWWRDTMVISSTSTRLEELKQKLKIK